MENIYVNERETDLNELFFFVLYKWRSIIVVAMVFAAMLGGYKIAKEIGDAADRKTTSDISEEFDKERGDFELQRLSYNRSISNIENEIRNINEYLENSILMNIDPYNIPMAKADCYIEMENGVITSDRLGIDPVDNFIGIYQAGIPRGLDWTEIEKITGITQEKYLEELIQVEASFEGNTVTVTVYYEDENTAVAILDNVLKQVEENCNRISGSIGEHSIVVLNRTSGTVVNQSLADRQRSNHENLITFNARLAERKKVVDELEESDEPVVMSTLSKRQIIKGGIKFAILGVVIGILLMVCFWALYYLLNGKIHGESDIKDSLGINVLGVFPVPLKKGFFSPIDLWICKLSGKDRSISDDEVIERVAIQLRSMQENSKRVLITGMIDEADLYMLKKHFSGYLPEMKFVVGRDLNRSAETLNSLASCDTVLIAEKREKTAFKQVEQEKTIITSLDKVIVGCVLL